MHTGGRQGVRVGERVVVIYSDPLYGSHDSLGEGATVVDVMDSVLPLERTLLEMGRHCTLVPLSPPLDLARSMLSRLDSTDVVFNLFEGFQGCPESEAAIAGALEKMQMRFTGSPSASLRLGENKAVAKDVLRWSGVPTPLWQLLTPQGVMDLYISLPCIVKPLAEHGSYGLTEKNVVEDPEALREQVEYIYQAYGCPSIVEEFLPGREFRALVVGDGHPRVLPIEEIIYRLPPHRPRLLTYRAKWVPDDEYFVGTEERCPADVGCDLEEELTRLALRAFAALGCRGYASIDMRQNREGRPMVIDVNPNTDINPAGSTRHPIEAAGLDYAAFISELLSLA
jgi:D-alanine-D-alanine ligase